MGDKRTPCMSGWNTATLVLYQRLIYGTSAAMSCCARE